MSTPTPPSDPFTPGFLTRLPDPPRRVAVLRASRIGDFLCATPAFRALRAAMPAAHITLITLPMLHELAERLSAFDHVVDFPGFPGIAEQLFDPRRAVAFFQRMQAERFDLAIQMQGSGVNSNPFTLLLGARYTAGFVRPSDPPGRLDAALPLPESGHEIRRLLALTTFLGAPPRGERTEFPLHPDDLTAATTLLAGASPPYIGLHPGARDRTRRWPPERFAAVGDALLRRYGGTLLLLGDDWERAAVEAVARSLSVAPLDLVGRTSLPVLGAVLSRLALLVTNDTGPAHIAYALGTPSVTIVGGADPAAYGPLAAGSHRILAHPVPCRPRGPTPCATCPHGYACLDAITPAHVIAAAIPLMEARSVDVPPPSDYDATCWQSE